MNKYLVTAYVRGKKKIPVEVEANTIQEAFNSVRDYYHGTVSSVLIKKVWQ